MNDLTHLSLFTGIGGIDLATEWAGFRTVAQVERDPFCRHDLARLWPLVPRFDDVRAVTARSLREAGIERPTLVSGGFPCQPFSVAGQRRGAEDDRFLWPEMLRVVSELRPPWVLGENVVGIISLALDDCIADLEHLGYSCRPFVVPAAGVGAPHQRERVFIVANADDATTARLGTDRREILPFAESEGFDVGGAHVAQWGDAPDAVRPRRQERHAPPVAEGSGLGAWRPDPFGGQWAVEPAVGRVADGVPGRVDRLRALGNAVVPQQVYPILRGITMIEGASA